MTDKSLNLSAPRPRVVCGYTVEKKTIRAYYQMMERLAAFPQELIDRCFPKDGASLLDSLAALNSETLVEMISGLLTRAPRLLVGIVADLLEVDPEKLETDPKIGPTELMDLAIAVAEVNKLADFFTKAAKAAKKFLPRIGGSKKQSSAALPSESPSANSLTITTPTSSK